jgi:hypothetical protein
MASKVTREIGDLPRALLRQAVDGAVPFVVSGCMRSVRLTGPKNDPATL